MITVKTISNIERTATPRYPEGNWRSGYVFSQIRFGAHRTFLHEVAQNDVFYRGVIEREYIINMWNGSNA